jgi:serine/threonine protein kinase
MTVVDSGKVLEGSDMPNSLRLVRTGDKDEAERDERDSEFGDVLDTKRYKIHGIYGRGTWGTVYKAKDGATGEEVALKVLTPNELAKQQLVDRKITPFEAMRKEGDLSPCAYVVPRAFEVDEAGTPFIRMPPYPITLNEKLKDCDEGENLKPKEERRYLGHGLDLEEIMAIARDVASGHEEIHQHMKAVHGDTKPDNIVYNPSTGRYMINDLGTRTCVSLGWAEKHDGPRNNMGFVYTRAPECFSEDPEKESDVWAEGALLYRMITGEYPMEGSESLWALGENGKAEINRVIRDKINRNVPRKGKLRKLLRDSLNAYTSQRIRDGSGMKKEIGRTVQSFSLLGEIKGALKKHGGWAAGLGSVAAAAIGISLGGINVSHTPEIRSQIQGLLYLGDSPDGERVFFDAENLRDLPETGEGAMIGAPERYSKQVTNDRNVAYLVHTHRKALDSARTREILTKHQSERFQHYMEYGGDPDGVKSQNMRHEVFAAPAIAIKEAIDNLKGEDGKVDLEDVLVMSRVGPGKFYEAKRMSDSTDFRHYVTARDFRGDYVIPEREQKFIKTWLAYIHKG